VDEAVIMNEAPEVSEEKGIDMLSTVGFMSTG
jgi:hypothetical protein